MKIEIKRLNDAFHLEAVNEQGRSVHLDASPDIGGTNLGMRPMQLVLSALGGCSTMDIINILKKQREPLRDIRIEVTAERQKDEIPSLFTKVHVHFKLFGDINVAKAEKAISLGVEKYCSVARILEKTALVTHSFEIIRNEDEEK